MSLLIFLVVLCAARRQPAPQSGVGHTQLGRGGIDCPAPHRIGGQQPRQPLCDSRLDQPHPRRIVEYQGGQLVQPCLSHRRAEGASVIDSAACHSAASNAAVISSRNPGTVWVGADFSGSRAASMSRISVR